MTLFRRHLPQFCLNLTESPFFFVVLFGFGERKMRYNCRLFALLRTVHYRKMVFEDKCALTDHMKSYSSTLTI